MVNGKISQRHARSFSIPLLIKAEILFREKHSLGQDGIGKDGLMWAGTQIHCSEAPISQKRVSSQGKNSCHEHDTIPGFISDLQLLPAFFIQLKRTQPVLKKNTDMK